MLNHRLAISVLLLAALVACDTLGIKKPETFLEGAAAAQVSITGLRQVALDNLNAGIITAKQARTAQSAANAGNEAIDVAMDAYVTVCQQPKAPAPAVVCDVPAASAKLDAAKAIISAARVILIQVTPKPKP